MDQSGLSWQCQVNISVKCAIMWIFLSASFLILLNFQTFPSELCYGTSLLPPRAVPVSHHPHTSPFHQEWQLGSGLGLPFPTPPSIPPLSPGCHLLPPLPLIHPPNLPVPSRLECQTGGDHSVSNNHHYTHSQLLSLSSNPTILPPTTLARITELGLDMALPCVGTETSSEMTSTLRPGLSSCKLYKRTRRGTRGGRNKRRHISVVHINSSYAHTTIRRHQPGVNVSNLTIVPIAPSTRKPQNILLTVFNAQSLGNSCKRKRSAINDFILSNHIDILCVTETWFRETGDEPKLRDLAPAGYTTMSSSFLPSSPIIN